MSVEAAELISRVRHLSYQAQLLATGLLSGGHTSAHFGQSVEFAQHKEYSPGDDLRRLDWKVVGRLDRYHVKQYEHESNVTAFLVVDGSGSMGYRSAKAPMSKYECAQLCAAALAYVLLHQGDAPGLRICGGSTLRRVPPSSVPSQFSVIAEELERSSPLGDTSIATALLALGRDAPQRSVIVVATDCVDDTENTLAALLALRHRGHDVSLLHVLDPAELSFPFDDRMIFASMEGPEELDVNPAELRASYLSQFEDFLRRCQSTCTSAGIGYARIVTNDPLDQALIQFTRRRSARAQR